MSRTLLLSLLIYGLIILGLASLQRELLALVIPLILYLGAGLLFGPRSIDLTIKRTLSADRVPHGQPVQVKVTITNNGPTLENLLLADLYPQELSVIDGFAETLTRLQSGETIELTYTLNGKRGYYQFGGLQVTASDLLGLFRKQARLAAPGYLFILPEVFRLPNVVVQPRRTRAYPGINRARKGGPGVEFYGVREYQPGDSLRWLNKRASARHEQTLYVNEFEQERAVDIGLIMDARQKTNLNIGGVSLFEHTVQATTTLAETFLSQGNRVGLFIYGGFIDWTFPGSGKIQRERILQALARAKLQNSMVFQKLEMLPTRLFPPRSQLVFISPLRLEDLEELIKVRAHGYPLLVASPDYVSFEEKTLEQTSMMALAARIARLERRQLFRRMREMGIQVFEWQVDTPFHEAAQIAFSRSPFLQWRVGDL
jgi:uncharacterized protein (DUF58 family)